MISDAQTREAITYHCSIGFSGIFRNTYSINCTHLNRIEKFQEEHEDPCQYQQATTALYPVQRIQRHVSQLRNPHPLARRQLYVPQKTCPLGEALVMVRDQTA